MLQLHWYHLKVIVPFLLLLAGSPDTGPGEPLHSPYFHPERKLSLTAIGEFGLWRKDRPGIPGHFHSGLDLARPVPDQQEVLIHPVASGTLISIRQKGPWSQVIIEHGKGRSVWWSVYEHFIPDNAKPGDTVHPDRPIGRLMRIPELNQYGWQFNHLHLELMKSAPKPLKPTTHEPGRRYITHGLSCFTMEQLRSAYWNPADWLPVSQGNTRPRT